MSATMPVQISETDQTFDLGGVDLNLLVVLNALLRCRNITHAGNEVRLSQPATTRALTRLRQMFDDDLLVRDQRSFELTPLAERLMPKIAAALANIEKIFVRLNPAPARFSLAMPDHLALGLVGNLAGYFREVSPTTVFLPVVGLRNVLNQLEEGQLDLVLGIADDAPPGFFSRMLPAMPSLCIASPGHAANNGRIAYPDLGRFLSIRVGSDYSSGFGEVYDGLEALRPRGGQTVTAPDIHTAARLLQDTDAVMVLPGVSALYIAARYGLTTFVPSAGPALPTYQVSLLWHERWHRNSIHAGVRSMIASHVMEGDG
ncbi:LysR family transcriptional regulator [Agrobacterium vitis]|uniref:LysR family transcriptional regulator n=1 Tax=Agrobacterium vitis TaxID=373 RepID=UPI001572B094|nr:LysR family transcriptional regulator [Agrobacterium vitis]NSZ19481.1 LysR family transcriptional regulator [Agrobacterium vitis]QZO06866.1 LysR family transcriptional regulator [Agrobacterium vitis]UJL91527.1 LysR family transcriptional regulator [Agrobacterium vitis]